MRSAFLQKYLPAINFAIGLSALTFQLTALYPWHLRLDADFNRLKEEMKRTQEEYHASKLARFEALEKNVLSALEHAKWMEENSKNNTNTNNITEKTSGSNNNGSARS